LANPKIDWGGFWERRGSLGDRQPVPFFSKEFMPVIQDEITRIEASFTPIAGSKTDERKMFECFVGLAAIFPMQDIGEHGFQIKQSILNQIFAEYPIKYLTEACVDFARTGEWFPRPKELIALIETAMGREKTKLKNLRELSEKILGIRE
jgi:hypothetical protein